MSSATVGITIWASGSVKQKPTRRRTSRPFVRVSSPSTVTVPAVGSTRPLRSRANVDLPEPFAPMTPIRCSGGCNGDVAEHGPRRGVLAVGVGHVAHVDQRHRCTTIATPWPPPTAIAARPSSPRSARTSWENSRTARTAPDAPHGWPSASAPPSTHTRSLVQAELVAAGEHLAGERLVELDHVQVGQGESGPVERRAHRGDQADPGQPRVHARPWRSPAPAGRAGRARRRCVRRPARPRRHRRSRRTSCRP